MVAPKFGWHPPRKRSLGPDCIAFWRAAGGSLFDWQELVVDGLLGLGDDDRWVSANDGICVARQNGKGVIEQAIEVFFAFELGYSVVMHTAHEFATSQEHQLRLTSFIQDCPHLHAKVKVKGGYMFANGRESINLKSGSRIIFKARTKGGGRGYSGDLLVWDEAMVLPSAVVGAQKPMLRASRAPHGPKTIYAGSAVDQLLHEHGEPFSLIRDRGIAKSPKIAYYEWSAPFEELDQMTDEVLRDRSWWTLANPSMPELIRPETMAEEIESMPARQAAVELGCVGDWPRANGANTIFEVNHWHSLEDESSMPEGPVVYAFDIRPDRSRGVITAIGRRADGLLHVEVGEQESGTAWMIPRLEQLEREKLPLAIVCDGVGPAASIVPELLQRNVTVTMLTTPQVGEACGMFFDAVQEGTLRHLGQPALLNAIKGAVQRPLGDRWAWSRRNSTSDISPLVACTLGVWKVVSEEQRAPLFAFG